MFSLILFQENYWVNINVQLCIRQPISYSSVVCSGKCRDILNKNGLDSSLQTLIFLYHNNKLLPRANAVQSKHMFKFALKYSCIKLNFGFHMALPHSCQF